MAAGVSEGDLAVYTRHKERLTFWLWFWGAFLVMGVGPSFFLDSFWQKFVTEVLILGLLAMSSDILIGYTGMVSFGHALFFGAGCYAAAFASIWTTPRPNLWFVLIFGTLVSGVFGIFVAYFSTRLREIYFSITTLVFSQIFWVIVLTSQWTGGENGISFDQAYFSFFGLFPVEFGTQSFHWFVMFVVGFSYLLCRRIMRSPFGMVLQSIRENEPRTRAIGYNVEHHKMAAVMLSALFAGLSGALYGVFNAYAAPDFFFFLLSGEIVIYNVLGGIGTLVGPIFGAMVFQFLKELLSTIWSAEYYLIPVGVLFVLMVIFMPQGLFGFVRRWLNE
jgi:branched-chain amino acid transport system permease protein